MSRIINYLTNGTPWAIEQGALESIIAIAQRDNNLEAVLQERGKPLDNTHKVEIRQGVAVIPVTGALFPRANLFSQVSGAYSVEMLALDLAQTANDPNVKGAVLAIDSPGGSTVMINEFAQQIKDYPKPIVAYVVGTAASAAYWIAAAADKIVMDSTAMVGSIGVVAAFTAQDSKTIEIVSSNAQDKRPDITTDAGKAVVRAIVDDMETVFIDAVMANRGMTREQITALRGGVVIGAKAVNLGFADQIGSLEQTILQLQAETTMDLSKLKADHPEVYQAAFKEGSASVTTDALAAKSEGVAQERQRITAILTHDNAKGRELQAQALALETDLAPEAAAKVLAVSPTTPTNAAATTNPFAQHMQTLGNPKIGADQEQEQQEHLANYGWDRAVAKVVPMRGTK